MTDLTEFWQDQHTSNTPWLTGTTFGMILDQYGLEPLTFQNRRCLEIGVGKGMITRCLSQLADVVYGCDISEEALSKVRSVTGGTWLTQDIEQIPSVDVVLCHLVFVHCDDNECERILRSINLADQGKIFCQFSCFKDPEIGANDANDKIKDLLDVGVKHFFRSTDEIEAMIQSAGLQIHRTWNRYPGDYHGWAGQTWQYYELSRQMKGIET